MRICLISPGHLSTNPRLVKEAFALQAAGHVVRVICGRYQRWGAASDVSIAAQLSAVQAVPFGPTEASPATYLRQTLVRRGARALVQRGIRAQGLIEAAHSPVVTDLIAAVSTAPADIYVAHYVAALPAAARAARRYGAIYAFDAEDFHLGDTPDVSEHELEKTLIRAIEAHYLPGAAYVTAASPLIAEAYAETHGLTLPTVILNVFPKKNAPPVATPSGSVRPGPSLYWFSQTIGPGRGIETALEAIARAQSRPHLYLRGAPAAGYDARLRSLAARVGVADRLHILDPVPPDELERLGASYDLGYVGELAETPNRQIALTNKLFSYLIGGVPSIATDIPAHQRLAPEFGQAMRLFPMGDAAGLAAILDNFLLDRDRLAHARAHAWLLGQTRFNWDVEQAKLLSIIDMVKAQLSGGASVSALG